MKFLGYLYILVLRVLSLTIFREEWAAEEKTTDVEEGYEYNELPGVQMNEEERRAFAKEHGLSYTEPDKNTTPPPPADPPKPDDKGKDKNEPEIVEVKANEKLTLEKAEELLKDFEDDEEVEILGETYTKKDFLAKIKETAETDDPDKDKDKKYTIGKDELTSEEYQALLADYKKEYGLSDEEIKAIPEKALNKQLEVFSKLENRSKSLNAESQKAAQIRRDLSKQAQYFEEKYKEYDQRKADLEKQKKELEATIAKKPEQEFDSIDDDDERAEKINDLKIDQKLAKSKLVDINDAIAVTDKSIKGIEKKVDDMAYHSTFLEINETIPALRLDRPAFEILNTRERPSDLNLTKIAGVHMRLAKDYLTFITNDPDSKWTVADYYGAYDYLYNPGVQAKSTEKKQPTASKDERKKRILKLITDQQHTPFSVKAGGGDPTLQRNKEELKVKKVMDDAGYGSDHSKFGVIGE